MPFAKAIPVSQPKAAIRAPPDTSYNSPGQPLVDFLLFAELAPELQDAIWEFACYSTPAIIPMFIDNDTFKFELHRLPAVPAILHSTSGARAIGLRHFTLVKAEKFNRSPPRPPQPAPPQHPLLQQAQAFFQIPPQAPLLHIQNQTNGLSALLWQNANGPHAQGTHTQGQAPTWMTNAYNVPHNPPGPTPPYGPAIFAPFQPTLPGQAQGQNYSMLHPYNAQPLALSQHHSQNLGANQPHGAVQLGQPSLGSVGHAPFQSMHQQSPGHQAHGAFQQGSQHPAMIQSIFGGLQPTSTQSLTQQNFAQHGFQHLGLGNQSLTHHGPQQQSIFGGSHQSTLAHQSFTQSVPQLPNAFQTLNQLGPQLNQSTTMAQTMNPHISVPAINVNALVQRPSRRLLITESDSKDRYFYVNHGSDFFRLQVGNPTGYHYPAFSLAQFPQLPNSVSDEDRLIYLQELQRMHILPSPFPADGRLPDFFDKIQHLVLNLELPPCHAPLRSYGFRSWMRRSISRFCSIVIKSTIAKFPNIKNLDLQIAGDIKRREGDRMVLRHWRYAPIREENGVTFGHAELGLLEMEIRLWMMGEFLGKDGAKGPEVRIVVHVPQQYSQTKW